MQQKLRLNGGLWGGLREGAGRKRARSRGVAHGLREKVSSGTPLHINFRYRSQVRNKDTLKLLKKAIRNARGHGLLVQQYSFQTNHIHLIVSAPDNKILTRSMRSLTITFAKGLNMGRIQVERYHLHVLRSIRETKNALRYVLFNQQKHEKGTCSTVNEYSSVLSMERGLELIRKFAKDKRMVLKIQKGELWKSNDGPYLYQRALNQLYA
jgi:hypothetical protein